jgi:hypothetical protein
MKASIPTEPPQREADSQTETPTDNDGRLSAKAPQDTLVTHIPFTEKGAWKIRYLHQIRRFDLHPWKALQDLPETRDPHPSVKVCPIERARQLQALIESGQFRNRAELAKHLKVSRARVTQILRRLDSPGSSR